MKASSPITMDEYGRLLVEPLGGGAGGADMDVPGGMTISLAMFPVMLTLPCMLPPVPCAAATITKTTKQATKIATVE